MEEEEEEGLDEEEDEEEERLWRTRSEEERSQARPCSQSPPRYCRAARGALLNPDLTTSRTNHVLAPGVQATNNVKQRILQQHAPPCPVLL